MSAIEEEPTYILHALMSNCQLNKSSHHTALQLTKSGGGGRQEATKIIEGERAAINNLLNAGNPVSTGS